MVATLIPDFIDDAILDEISDVTAGLRRDRCRVVRAGYVRGEYGCRIESRPGAPGAADPNDASASATATRVVYFPRRAEVAVGDEVQWRGETFTVGDVPPMTYMAEVAAVLSAPQLATPMVTLILERQDSITELWDYLPAQMVQIVFANRAAKEVGGRLGALAVRTEEGVFVRPEPFDVLPGDEFSLNGSRGRVLAVPPPAAGRVEAAFEMERGVS